MNCYFEYTRRVDSHDCDSSDLLKPSGFFRYMQEGANLQCQRAGFGYDDNLARGTAFMLSRAALDVYTPLRPYEVISVRTCPANSSGLSFNRCTGIYKDGKCAAQLTSVWALVKLSDRSLVRVSESGLTLPTVEMPKTSAPLVLRIGRSAAFEKVGELHVTYSLCDRNRHMNNTRYPDVLCDFSGDLTGKTAVALSLSYLGEAPLGETLQVWRAQGETPAGIDGATSLFRILRESDGRVCCEALITFKSI